jgi:hypothetical protein
MEEDDMRKVDSIFWGIFLILAGTLLQLLTLGILSLGNWTTIFWSFALIAVGVWIFLRNIPFGQRTIRVQDFFSQGSPLWPDVDSQIVDQIKKDLRSDPTYYPAEAIAKHLVLFGGQMSMELLGKRVQLDQKRVTITPDEANAYSRGFVAPVFLLQFSYISVAHGLPAAHQALSSHPNVVNNSEFQNILHDNLEYAAKLLAQDTSGKRLIEDFVQKESRQSSDLYYRVGLEAARRTFLAYHERLRVK